jgi:DNA-binding IclR family transcriptional regulator
MLVYRDFAEQQEDRRYRAGPVWRADTPPEAPVARLRAAALPHLRRLVDDLGETANVAVLAGADVRFVATVECDQVLRVGDRTGRTLPAHLASGGKAILAGMADAERDALLEGVDVDLPRLRKELALVRRRGFALNDQATEAGLAAVGVALPGAGEGLRAGLSLAVPTVRFSRDLLPAWVAALTAAAAAIGAELTGP